MAYATLEELKARVMPALVSSTNDDALENALDVASNAVDAYCRRTFTKDTVASARTFEALAPRLVHLDDFYTATDLAVKVDMDGDGVYEATLEAADFTTLPRARHGETWPFWQIKARPFATTCFPCWEDGVEVTALWGWAAVPPAVKEAALILAEETYKLKDAPFGIQGYGDYGPVRVRDNPKVATMLVPYRRRSVLVA